MLQKDTSFKLTNYTGILKEGHFNRRSHGGVGIYLHESVPFREINLTSPIQAVAIQANLGTLITVVSIYNSRSHQLTTTLLNNILEQLPKPVILAGDFNSYHQAWGSPTTDTRGNQVMKFIQDNNLNLLNDGRPTRTSGNSSSAIDLTLVSPQLHPLLDWSVTDSPLDSDHCLITIDLQNDITNCEPPKTILNIRKADWTKFQNSTAWEIDTEEFEHEDARSLTQVFYEKIRLANQTAIPKITIGKFYPKPWWSKELSDARDKRERFLKIYRKTKFNRHLIAWKKARAKFKQIQRKNKKENWENFANSINNNTPVNKVWEKVRRIKGRTQRKTHILEVDGRTYQNVKDIADKIGDTFSQISSPSNYEPNFRSIKAEEERKTINFSSENAEIYNKEFTMEELKQAITETKCTTPGPDEIHNLMLKNLPAKGLSLLLLLFNKIWFQEYFPPTWLKSIVIPIPKPDKDPANPSNYRPIALTSALCKTLERMVNTRLIEYLEQNNTLSNLQCGGRKKRSTIDHLIALETAIRKAQANNEEIVSIFFDMEKAYDMTWRHGILKNIHRIGIRGRMAAYIKNFLSERKFQVKINNTLSAIKTQKEGIPQGSVISPTFFIIHIDKILNNILKNNRYQASLFMDDLQISYRHPNIQEIEINLQQSINKFVKFSNENGFKFSITKSTLMHFSRSPASRIPELKLNQTRLTPAKTVKYLGLVFDDKLDWQAHIQLLKKKCNKTLNLLRTISSMEWGADSKTLMKIYVALIRSRIDYGSIIYNSANKQNLKSIETVSNEAMRIASRCFKTTPISSLQVITNEPPLQLRRDKLSLKYYYKIRSLPSNPTFNLLSVEQETLYANKNLPPPFAIRIKSLHNKYNINRQHILPDFSYSLLKIKEPTWSISEPKVNLNLTKFPKDLTPNIIYQEKFREILEEKYSQWTYLYTDGSKNKDGVGAAIYSEGTTSSASLPKFSTIFTAEAHAIQMALNTIRKK